MAFRLSLLVIVWTCSHAVAAGQSTDAVIDARTVQHGRALYRAGRYEEAEPLLAGALAAIDEGTLARNELQRCLGPLTEIYFHLRRYEDALRVGQRYGQSLRDAATSNPTGFAKAVQDNHLLVGNAHFALAQYDEARQALQSALRIQGGNHAVNPTWALQVYEKLADVAQLRGDTRREAQLREYLVTASAGLVEKIERGQLRADYEAPCVKLLCDSLMQLERDAEAIEAMEKLLKRQSARGRQPSADFARVQLAELHARLNQYPQAVQYLNAALKNARDGSDSHYHEADLLHRLANVNKSAGDLDRARESWQAAAALDEKFLTDAARTGNLHPNTALAAWRRLRTAYTETGSHSQALNAARRIVDYQADRGGALDREFQIDKSQLAVLYGAVGHYEAALPLLTESLQYWRQARPPDSDALASALNNLASVHRATGDYDAAQSLFVEALELRKRDLAGDDPRLAEAYSNLASVYSARGQYATALSLYRNGLAVSRAAGPRGEALAGLLLGNLAMVYRSQGQLAKAADYSRQALDVGQRLFDDHPSTVTARLLADRYLAQASLELAADDAQAARRACQQALTLINQHDVTAELAAAARRMLGTAHYQDDQLDDARREWEAAVALQKQLGLRSEAARTLTFLGDVAVKRRDFDRAESLYREALAQQEDFQALPIVHFNALVNLGQLLYYHAGQEDEAVRMLIEAAKLLEIPRAETEGGGEGHRAEFFSRHSRAFDLLVDWSLADGRVEDAILYAERGRNRTFLDQLRLAGVDLRDTLPDDQMGRQLRQREHQLSTRVSTLRSMALAAGRGQAEGQSLAEAAAQLRQAQADYALLMAEIRDHSPFYRELLAERAEIGSLAMIRRHVLSADNMLLIYYLGERSSYLISVDRRENNGAAPLQFFPLSVPESLADDLAVAAGPLTREKATTLVASFLATIRDREGARGLAGIVQSPRGMMTGDQGAALAEVLLPRDVRKLVADRAADHLVVVPDGALHQMPLEALLVESNPPKYVLDIFPPITYAPSATILASLAARNKQNLAQNGELLTVGNPVYPTPSDDELATLTAAGRSTFLDLGGVLTALPGSATECERIFDAFGASRASKLLADSATEGNVRASLANRRFVHLAAHGLVDERNDNLFGAIALTPPAGEDARPDNDGFLRLHEIHGLPLAACELAALSACQTNVGPRRPLEAGSTLARAFLSAGARRVVSSHWNVDDAASSELVSLFFEKLAAGIDAGEPVDYARSMHEARVAIRAQEKWRAPYFWAPFVLVGPAR